MSFSEPVSEALFFVALWMGVSYTVGFVSGWHELARSYRHAGQFLGTRWRFQNGRRLLMGFHNVLTLGVNSQGMYLGTFVLFRVGLPPLFIPWGDVSTKERKVLLWKVVEFRFRQAPSVFLRLSSTLAEKMRAAAGDCWPDDRGAIIPF